MKNKIARAIQSWHCSGTTEPPCNDYDDCICFNSVDSIVAAVFSNVSIEKIARAYDPVGWKWFDETKDPKLDKAKELFAKDSLSSATRVYNMLKD